MLQGIALLGGVTPEKGHFSGKTPPMVQGYGRCTKNDTFLI